MANPREIEENMEDQPGAENAQETEEEIPIVEGVEEAPEVAETDGSAESLQEALDAATEQAADNWDKFVRAQAELDNQIKRAKRDLENAHKFGLEKFINELLPVWDGMEMGLSHADGEADAEKLKEGYEMTLRMMTQAMEKFNVTQIDPQGEAFDPAQHEAMTMQPSDEVAPNHILAVIQKGYMLNDRLIRPARVVVAKAPE